MKALTDPAARHLERLVPRRVPSGLPVDGAGLPYGDPNKDYDSDD